MKSILKKLLISALAVCMISAAFPVLGGSSEVYADDTLVNGSEFTVDGLVYRVTDAEAHTAMLFDITDPTLSEIVVPGTVEYNDIDWAVKKIAGVEDDCYMEWPEGCSVILEAGIEEIGQHAFVGPAITGISLPNTLLQIRESAFQNTQNLKAVELPDSVVEIEKNAFMTSGIQTVRLPARIKKLPFALFQDCDSLKEVTIPDSVDTVDGWAFFGCDSLESVIIPDSVTSIGERAFYYSAVSSLELPSALQTLGKECFAGCGNLTEIAIPDELETIPESCFTGCKTLSSVTLPGNLKSIEQEAFGNCDGLEGITLPSGLESIDAFAFADCSSLKSITIPGSVRSIGEEAFVLCGNLSSVVIEEGLEELYGDVFSNCTSLTELTIPSSVTALEDFTEIEGVDMSNLIIRAEEGSTAAAFAEQNGVACIEPDDVLIGLSVDVSLLTKFTSVYTEGTAAEEIAGLVTVDPAYADEFAVDEARSGLAKIAGSEVSGIGSGSDLLDPAADYAVKIAVAPAEGTALPDVSQIAWKYNGKLTEPLLTETAGAGVNVYFHLGRPAEAAAGTLYQIKVNGGTANLAESVAGNVIIATPSAAPAGNKFTGWKVIAGDMETETAEDGTVRFIMPEGNVELTAEFSQIISLIGVKNVWKTPEAGKPVAFSAAVDSSISGIAEKISIEEETWQSDDQASVIKKSSSAIPEVGKTYSYSLTLKAKEGYVFDDGFTFILDSMMIPCRYELIGGGKEIVISGIVPDVKITWNLADTEIAELRSYTYSGTARKPAVTITKDGAALVKGTDFTVSYKNNINAGTAQAVIKGKGNYSGTVTKTFKINAKKVTPKVTLKTAAYVFNGKVKTPSVTVKAGTVTLVKGTDYTVIYASGRKNVGTYKVTVKLKGNYSGSKAVSFKINPKGTTLSTVTAASKGFTAKWNKQSAKMASSVITGYQIQYSRSSTFATGNKTVTVKGYKNISKKITGLKAGKKYYVRIRTYKTVSGKPYYSAWSAKKSVTTVK